jgi:hypothetical protein
MITIFGEKIGVFLKNQCYDHIFLALFLSRRIGYWSRFEDFFLYVQLLLG